MPGNYDNIFRGPVSLRDALAQSINIPAVKVLYLAGLKNSLNTARKMGINTLSDSNRYGLTLVLGGGEVSLLEMTSAYGVFANEGVKNNPTGILSIEDARGNILESLSPKGEQVMNPTVALQISDILSDNKARTPAFGEDSYLRVRGHDVAVKTGTTNDYRDAWIVGYTPNLSVGAWAGNNDNTEMEKKVAGFIIAPLWNEFMKKALALSPQEPFKKADITYPENLKPILRGVWGGGESYFIDRISGKLATQYTPSETREEKVIPNIHSILYWVNKEDPLGEKPQKPEDDSQFILWETPIKKWASYQNSTGGGQKIPTESDDIHKPEFAPHISIIGIQENQEYNPNQKILFTIEGKGRYPIKRVDVFVGGIYLGKTEKMPFIFSFVPNEIAGIQYENQIRVIMYDTVMNKSEKIFTLKVNI